jgi:TonB family protein
MPVEPREIPETIPEEKLGSLRGCLVDGDAEQRGRERRVRRRALAISVVFQSAILALLVFVSLFGKGESIALANVTPIPPYSPYRNSSDNSGEQRRPRRPQNICHFCAPTKISPIIPTRDKNMSGNQTDESPFEGIGTNIPGMPDGLIPITDARQRVIERDHIEKREEKPRVIRMTHLDPGMLIHRVEPVYPPLARQIHKEGRVELRAVIGNDGTIQSLQIVAGDPLLERSAVEAVQQWRYQPTILNGQPVEIDTYITVIYTMQH